MCKIKNSYMSDLCEERQNRVTQNRVTQNRVAQNRVTQNKVQFSFLRFTMNGNSFRTKSLIGESKYSFLVF